MTEILPKEGAWVDVAARLRTDEYERLRREAFDRRISMAEIIRQALEAYFASNPAEAGPKPG